MSQSFCLRNILDSGLRRNDGGWLVLCTYGTERSLTMIRGGYRGGARRSSGGRSSARRSSSSRSGARPKGQIKSGKKVQYAIKSGKGSTKYYGTTNNPSRRAAQHRKAGKLGRGDRLVVQTKPISQKSAERVEAAKLSSHRRHHGRNPKHNTTNDGKYHQPRLF